MKKYLFLTSALALAACGGGGGSGGPGGHVAQPTTPGDPAIHVQGFSGGTTVNAENAELTNMSSYTVDYGTDENTTKQAMVNYVNTHLGSSRSISLNRSATRATSGHARDGGFTAEDFARADAAITQMKQVLYDMVGKSSDAELKTYVARYRYAVVNALKMQDVAVTDETSIDDLVSEFSTLKGTKGWTNENIMAALDQFDLDEFEITKHKMDDVRLKDTGEEGFFKFKLDTAGKIQSVALMEDPTSEYGSSWANKRVILSGGHAVEAGLGEGGSLNPFNTDYLTDKAGVLVRNGTEFSNNVHVYSFQLGKYNEGTGALVLTSGHDASAMLQPDDLKKIEITSEAALTPETAKEQLVQYIIERINKKMHNQGGGDIAVDLQDAIEVANWYIDKVNASIDTDAIAAADQGIVHQIAAMHGMGKEDGVKLKYSDFGYTSLTRNDGNTSSTQYVTYVGGYDDRRMDNTPANNNLDNNTIFTGTAIVTVEDHHRNKTLDTESRKTALYKDTTAQLQYNIVGDKARHTLTMGGLKAIDGQVTTNSDWYSMVVQGTEDNPNLSVTFDAAGKTIDSDYQFFRADAEGNITRNEANNIAVGDRIVNSTGTTANTINMVTGTQSLIEEHHKLNGSASAEYYGQDPSNPTEATSGVWMDERWANDGNTIQHEVSVYGAFGGQKDAE